MTDCPYRYPSPEVIADPFPFYAWLREAKVHQLENGSYMVAGYDDIVSIVRDPETFSNRVGPLEIFDFPPEDEADFIRRASGQGPIGSKLASPEERGREQRNRVELAGYFEVTLAEAVTQLSAEATPPDLARR